MNDIDLLNVHEAAAFLKTGPYVVRALLRAGTLEGMKVAGQWRTTREALCKYLIAQLEIRAR